MGKPVRWFCCVQRVSRNTTPPEGVAKTPYPLPLRPPVAGLVPFLAGQLVGGLAEPFNGFQFLPHGLHVDAVYLPKNHFIKEESMATDKYLSLFYPFDQLDLVKKGIESTWNVSGDRTMIALTMTFMDEPMAKNMSFQREYAEPYDWVAQQFKDWAFTLTTAFFYYNDYDFMGEDERGLHRKAMAAFGGIAPSYHIELLDKPTIYWDFHSLLLGIQMMFSFMLVDGDQPLRLCKHCQKVFLGSRSNAAFCSPRCKNQYNVYKSRSKKGGNEEE